MKINKLLQNFFYKQDLSFCVEPNFNKSIKYVMFMCKASGIKYPHKYPVTFKTFGNSFSSSDYDADSQTVGRKRGI